MSSSNILTITDNSGSITSMSYVTGAPLHVTSGESHDTAPTIAQKGSVFTITFNCNRKSSSSVATSFNQASGGGTCEYAAYGGGGSPDELHFWFQLTIHFTGVNGSGSATLNVGQGRSGLRNNWWLGGSIVNSARPRLELPYLTNYPSNNKTYQLNIPISGEVSAYTFWAGTSTLWCPIRYFFVLMLENHSFDNMFAGSGLHGIIAATTANSNMYNGTIYPVTTSNAPVCMPTDPGHEFEDVVQQLCGQSAQYQPNHNYPPINNSGFAYNYATSQTEGTGPAPSSDIGDVMACFDTPNQLPVLYQLATKFVLCDHWFSSLPGPTWPNRFFLHGASSNGLDDSPSWQQMTEWLSGIGNNFPQGSGFAYPHGSIFDALRNKNIEYRIYADWNNSFSDDQQGIASIGGTPQVASLHNITVMDAYSLKDGNSNTFAEDLQAKYTAQYTFIEPNYGDVASSTYAGGSSQHPMDDVHGGEALIKYIYESIRNSPLWDHSMLIITYDEHGGFYDSAFPSSCAAPEDSLKNYNQSSSELSTHGFTFTKLGVRVPAVIVSPWVSGGSGNTPVVDSNVYDHSSVLATIEAAFGFGPLTMRDASMPNLLHLCNTTMRHDSDCPHTLRAPASPQPAEVKAANRKPFNPEEPLPNKGALIGTLHIALKTEIEMSSGTDEEKKALIEKFKLIKNRGQAAAYISSVMERANAKRAEKNARRKQNQMQDEGRLNPA